MKAARFIFCVVTAALVVGVTPDNAHAQAPRLVNAKTETRAAASDFTAQFAGIVRNAQGPEWFGYSVQAIAGDRQMCCGSYDDGHMITCGTCSLEDERHGGMTNMDSSKNEPGTVKLEGPSQLVVMFRAERGKVQRIRMFSEDCELDAGGLRVIWLTGVSASQSVAVLMPFVETGTDSDETHGDNTANGALAAIAMTGDASADRAMEHFVATSEPEAVRKRAVFWLGAARGHAGYELLQKLGRGDASDEVREKVAFALYVSKDPAAPGEMIRMAKDDQSSRVREQAIFWVAQKAGKKAESAITSAIENDPNTEVKKRAVFALSQLPREQGVPLLIQVAKTNANPAVRKQAIFWLGQSHDPRALAFFEEILGR